MILRAPDKNCTKRACFRSAFPLRAASSSNRPAGKGCRGGSFMCSLFALGQSSNAFTRCAFFAQRETEMPKLKTKSGAKKRFKITGTGKVKYTQSGKRHGMIKRSTKQIREHRGTAILFKTDGDNIKKYFLPNG
jgi:large subunit ribosomal protein L35